MKTLRAVTVCSGLFLAVGLTAFTTLESPKTVESHSVSAPSPVEIPTAPPVEGDATGINDLSVRTSEPSTDPSPSVSAEASDAPQPAKVDKTDHTDGQPSSSSSPEVRESHPSAKTAPQSPQPTTPPSTTDAQNPPAKKSNSAPQPPVSSNDDGIVFTDHIVGTDSDGLHIKCGGLWTYDTNFLAREINCPGSQRYHSLQNGQKIKIDNRTCTMVGRQKLNYNTDDMSDVTWFGNLIVQTCYSHGGGDVTLVSFNCS